jgi:hypothetical protein
MSVQTNPQAARVLESIVAERADQDAQRTYTPRTDKRPSGKQVYRIARELCAIADIAWPESSAEASAIISRLIAQSAAVAAVEAGQTDPDDIPAF